MNLEVKKLAEQWEYIQGGFLFLQETGPKEAENALALADGELSYYISTLSADAHRTEALKEGLNLTSSAIAYEEVPLSLVLMSDQDISFVKEEGGAVDESYGSVALVKFYQYVRDYLKVPSSACGKMKDYVRSRFEEALPETDVIF